MTSRRKVSFLFLFSIFVFFVLSVAPVIAEIQKPALTIEIGNWGGEEGDWVDVDGDGSAEYCPPGTEGDKTKCICIPWMGQYIAAVYRYSVGIAAVLAVVMIMVGGFIWLVSGGSPDKIGRAKEFIISALIGLALALFSYVILYTINPRLVNLEGIRAVLPRDYNYTDDTSVGIQGCCRISCSEGGITCLFVNDIEKNCEARTVKDVSNCGDQKYEPFSGKSCDQVYGCYGSSSDVSVYEGCCKIYWIGQDSEILSRCENRENLSDCNVDSGIIGSVKKVPVPGQNCDVIPECAGKIN